MFAVSKSLSEIFYEPKTPMLRRKVWHGTAIDMWPIAAARTEQAGTQIVSANVIDRINFGSACWPCVLLPQ
jgi:hypothetical protein